MVVELGIDLSHFTSKQGPRALSAYRRALALLRPPFTTAWLQDHLQFGAEPVFEGWTALTYIAAEFPQFKVGSLVLRQSYRNPALLAKMAASLQLLSGGRLILGIGAGWHEEEYGAYGYAFPRAAARVAQLDETLAILRALWTRAPATYHGQYFHVENAYCEPRPDPRIPILIGTEGNKALGVAAKWADLWNGGAPLERLAPSYNRLRQQCVEVGRDVKEIAITCVATVSFPADLDSVVPSRSTQLLCLGPRPADALAQLQPLIDFGVSHIMLRFDNFTTLERFCAEMAPALVVEA
jgi:alkanesulfonate monooxygenase SsuD/methylene tetrahydromethanopterin reductase-like flavin-dependent oxidoreductase (luciferase family)